MAAAVTAAFFLAGCKQDPAGQPAFNAPPVKVGAPVKQTLTEYDEFTGRFETAQRVDLRARVGGYLEAVKFVEGRSVKKGDVLFVIDRRPLRIALERAQAQHDLTRKQFERAKGLRTGNAISQEDLDRREQALRAAEADLKEAQLNLDFTEVKSPIDGRIGKIAVDVGNSITADQTLLATVVSQSPMYFYFEVDENQWLKYRHLNAGGRHGNLRTASLPVRARLADEQGFPRSGRIDFVDNEVDRSTGTVRVRAVFDNRDDALLPGLFARVRIAGSDPYEALLVPDEAVGTDQTQKIVFTVNADNVIEPHPVTAGPLHNGTWRIIRSGLSPADRIVWSGVAKIRPGMKVTPQPSEDAGTPGVQP